MNVPADIAPDELTPERAAELFDQPNGDVSLGTDPDSGHQIVAKSGRFGPYVTEVLPEGATAKPRTSSLLKSMALDTVTLEDAVRLLTLPRTLGELDGEPVTAQNGRYGPYVKKGTDSRSLDERGAAFHPVARRGQGTVRPAQGQRPPGPTAAPLRELGEDPASSRAIVIKEGRYGPYVTDGETNASLRRGDEVESITVQRAIELLAERRAAAPAAPRRKPVVRDRHHGNAGRALGDAAVGEFVPEPAVVHRGRLTPARAPAPAPGLSRAAGPRASRGCRARPPASRPGPLVSRPAGRHRSPDRGELVHSGPGRPRGTGAIGTLAP